MRVLQDGYVVVALDEIGKSPVITEWRAGNYKVGVTVTIGTVAYVTLRIVIYAYLSVNVGALSTPLGSESKHYLD